MGSDLKPLLPPIGSPPPDQPFWINIRKDLGLHIAKTPGNGPARLGTDRTSPPGKSACEELAQKAAQAREPKLRQLQETRDKDVAASAERLKQDIIDTRNGRPNAGLTNKTMHTAQLSELDLEQAESDPLYKFLDGHDQQVLRLCMETADEINARDSAIKALQERKDDPKAVDVAGMRGSYKYPDSYYDNMINKLSQERADLKASMSSLARDTVIPQQQIDAWSYDDEPLGQSLVKGATPGVGNITSGRESYARFQNGQYFQGVVAAIGAIPEIGLLSKVKYIGRIAKAEKLLAKEKPGKVMAAIQKILHGDSIKAKEGNALLRSARKCASGKCP